MRKSLPLFVAAFTLAGAGMASAANDQRHAVTPEQAAAAPLTAAAADVSGTHTRQGVVYQADGAFLTLMDGTAFLIGDPRMTEVARGEVVTITYHADDGFNRATSILKGVTDSVEGTGGNGNTIGAGGTGGGGWLGIQPRSRGS
ncbi:hypothetical protein WI697_06355 [Tistrella mobilis]|uniref:hypothetical protein n=1 Tax=Tistrella mobilis TaxID=171437 RepID=UPI0031F6C98E